MYIAFLTSLNINGEVAKDEISSPTPTLCFICLTHHSHHLLLTTLNMASLVPSTSATNPGHRREWISPITAIYPLQRFSGEVWYHTWTRLCRVAQELADELERPTVKALEEATRLAGLRLDTLREHRPSQR